ncbi:MAG: DUF3307 domain-containing protein [Akkermansiaceae bacterium]|nr:DUF3307 domain-containing protein [Akkermansiaceae bacterium]
MIEILNIHPQCFSGALALFLALAIGHVVADFPLQGIFLSQAKNRNQKLSQQLNSKSPRCVWLHAMSAHSLIHCGAVWLITGSVILGLAEFVLHWFIDFTKCENWTGFNTDQFLHYLCKIIYVALIYYGVISIG